MKRQRTTITCRCDAYPFPHRWKGGKCKVEKPHTFTNKQNKEALEFELWHERLIIRDAPEFEYDD